MALDVSHVTYADLVGWLGKKRLAQNAVRAAQIAYQANPTNLALRSALIRAQESLNSVNSGFVQVRDAYNRLNPTAATATATAPAASGGLTPPAGDAAQQDAKAFIQDQLDQYGLGSMADWAWKEIQQGRTNNEILADLRQTPEFQQAFPEIAARQKAGLPPVSPGEIVSYRNSAQQMMRAAGLPPGFWDSPTDFASLIAKNVSLNELSQRVQLAQQAANEVPQEVRDILATKYGLDQGHLAAVFLDPDRAEPVLLRDFHAAQIGAAASRTGFGQTTMGQNERLADLGVSEAQAQQGFSALAQSKELMGSLPGENTTGISADEQLAAAFGGDAGAQQEIERRRQQRIAAFAGGGQFATSNQGFTGIGAAQGA